jgi:hypothetical protein
MLSPPAGQQQAGQGPSAIAGQRTQSGEDGNKENCSVVGNKKLPSNEESTTDIDVILTQIQQKAIANQTQG